MMTGIFYIVFLCMYFHIVLLFICIVLLSFLLPSPMDLMDWKCASNDVIYSVIDDEFLEIMYFIMCDHRQMMCQY